MRSFKMEKERNSQLELFSRGQKGFGEAKSQTANNSLFSYIWGYEKVILIIIGLMITGTVSFSLGVEKGKRLTHSDSETITVPKTIINPKTQIQPTIEKENIIQEPTPKDSLQYYTIQLASYQSRTSAQREAQELRKKGFSPLVLAKGKYTVLCVGNFYNKETARSSLSELKKQYRDCFIRRL